jgi:hypothetical protein
MSPDPDGPLDEIDAAILAQLREMYATLDPPPPALAEQVCFALELEDIDVEVARLQDETLIGSGARSSSRSVTLTFETASLSLLVSITELGDQQIRVDGWLAPPGAEQVELRYAPGPAGPAGHRVTVRSARPDAAGRFVFDGLHPGLAQLRIHPGGEPAGRSVITPSFRL